MPLVIFKLTGNDGFPKPMGNQTEDLNGKLMVANLPREARNKRWWLRSVNMMKTGQITQRLRWLELELPQLMEEDSTLYFLKSGGETSTPNKRLRFYPNGGSQDERVWENSMASINITPNIYFGMKRVDEMFIEMRVYAKMNDDTFTGVTTMEVILEYD